MTQPAQLTMHMFDGASHVWPAGQVVVPASQRSVLSLHVSTPLQNTPSLQLRVVPVQTAEALQVSTAVQKLRSLHEPPVLVLQTVGVAVRQIWHWLVGLIVFAA
jgi:hypothetical protein